MMMIMMMMTIMIGWNQNCLLLRIPLICPEININLGVPQQYSSGDQKKDFLGRKIERQCWPCGQVVETGINM